MYGLFSLLFLVPIYSFYYYHYIADVYVYAFIKNLNVQKFKMHNKIFKAKCTL